MQDIRPSRPASTSARRQPRSTRGTNAQLDNMYEQISQELPQSPPAASQPKKQVAFWRRPLQHWAAWPRRRRIVVGIVLLLLVTGGAAAGIIISTSGDPPAQASIINEPEPIAKPEPPKSTTVPSPLTGVETAPEQAQRPVTGIMVENSPVARPQSGLLEAGVVFEAIAEGGITRFLAIYQEGAPNYIGPVRSARPYFVQWLAPFNASYAHVGGDVEGLQTVRELGLRDLDQFSLGTTAYERISYRRAPHNVYTGFDRLDQANQSRGYTSSKFTGWPRKTEVTADITAGAIELDISSHTYNPRYDYIKETNTYKRFIGGKPHTDERSGTQIAPKVVIAMQISNGGLRGVDGNRWQYDSIGSGKAWVFQDGGVTAGTWHKASAAAQLEFKDAAGQPIHLNPGQTWISAVSGASWQ